MTDNHTILMIIKRDLLCLLAIVAQITQLLASPLSAELAGEPITELKSNNICRPVADPTETHYIIGYGSLMQEASRLRTAPKAGNAYPIEVYGYRRGWYMQAPEFKLGGTFLGVMQDAKGKFNAVVYSVPNLEELYDTDKREFGYCRQEVKINQVKMLGGNLPSGQMWIYVTPKHDKLQVVPTVNAPIVQSYVDIFISGCLEQQERFKLQNFAQQCIATTNAWSKYWVNDRIYPRRPFIYQPKAFQIDKLLNSELPEYFSQLTIE